MPGRARVAVIGRLARWWMAPVPGERLAAVRLLVGAFALAYLWNQWVTLWRLTSLPARSFAPVGPLRWLLDEPLGAGAWHAAMIVTAVLAIAFAAGIAYRVLGPLFAMALLVVTSYRNSWGMIFHTENLLVLHVLVLALAPAACAWSVDRAFRRASRGAGEPATTSAWPLRTMAAVTCLAYVLAGVAKLRLGGLDWISGEELRDQVAIDNLRKVLLGSTASPFATPVLEHPGFFTAFAALTVAIELGAPVAMVGGRIGAAWALGAWGFHVGVVVLMKIVFPYPLSGVAFAPLFAAERPFLAVRDRLRRWRLGSGVERP
jgi:hypothetical protein